MYFVYVLQSQKDQSLYKGYTENLMERIKQHNLGKAKYTSSKRPWNVIYYEEYSTLEEARNREKYLKTAAGRRFLKKIL